MLYQDAYRFSLPAKILIPSSSTWSFAGGCVAVLCSLTHCLIGSLQCLPWTAVILVTSLRSEGPWRIMLFVLLSLNSWRDHSKWLAGGAKRYRRRHVGVCSWEPQVPHQYRFHEHLTVPQGFPSRQRPDPPEHHEENVHVHRRHPVGWRPLLPLPQVNTWHWHGIGTVYNHGPLWQQIKDTAGKQIV